MLSMKEKQALTAAIVRRYKNSSKKEKGVILAEFLAVTSYNRCYATRMLRQAQSHDFRKTRKVAKTRQKKYGKELVSPLKMLWATSNHICGKRLKSVIPEYIRLLERDNIFTFSTTQKKQLITISPATIDRVLQPIRAQIALKGRSLTKPGTLLKHQIPIRTFSDWDDDRPGFFELDGVCFCGDSPKGDWVYGLDFTDVATGWVSLEAVWGKGQFGIHDATDRVRLRLFFRLLGIDSDNGGEFINAIMLRYAQLHSITFTRTRSGKKNDKCYVEQKNYTVLRTFVGYERYDTKEQLAIMKELLICVELFVNFFQASAKLVEKHRNGATVTKHHDKPLTQYQRLCRSGILSKDQRQKLHELYSLQNPYTLKKKIEELQTKLRRTIKSTI